MEDPFDAFGQTDYCGKSPHGNRRSGNQKDHQQMKKIAIVLMFWPLLGLGQFFDNVDDQDPSDSGTSFFSGENSGNDDVYENPNYVDPDMGVDMGGSNPGEPSVPIDNFWWILPVIGIAFGTYRLLKTPEKIPS